MTLKDLMKNSVLPESYKVNKINEDANKRGRSNDNANRVDRNKDQSDSKYTYSKQKEVNKLAAGGNTKGVAETSSIGCPSPASACSAVSLCLSESDGQGE